MRAHVVLRSAKGGPWESVDGWCTAKFLSGADGEEPLPEVGSKPITLSIKFPPCTDTGRVLLFPGQGAQKVGMLAPYEDVAGVREMFSDASEVFGRIY